MSAQTFFITATDTGAGKTAVTCALLRGLRTAGIRACGFKPIAAGGIHTAQGFFNDDALALQRAAETDVPYIHINPCLYHEPIAPHIAAAHASRPVDIAAIQAAHAALASQFSVILAEGAGGWLVPLNAHLLLGDWVAAQGWPVILVVGMRLGCLNHALLSAEAIQRRTRLAGWVANCLPPAMPFWEENIASLERYIPAPLLGVLPMATPGDDAMRLDTVALHRLMRCHE
jgi:dethiobiotin synthetase